jgi:hypothetical protein
LLHRIVVPPLLQSHSLVVLQEVAPFPFDAVQVLQYQVDELQTGQAPQVFVQDHPQLSVPEVVVPQAGVLALQEVTVQAQAPQVFVQDHPQLSVPEVVVPQAGVLALHEVTVQHASILQFLFV